MTEELDNYQVETEEMVANYSVLSLLDSETHPTLETAVLSPMQQRNNNYIMLLQHTVPIGLTGEEVNFSEFLEALTTSEAGLTLQKPSKNGIIVKNVRPVYGTAQVQFDILENDMVVALIQYEVEVFGVHMNVKDKNK